MKILYAQFTATQGNADEVASMLADLARNVHQEPGNIRFEPFQHEDDPHKFFVMEIYRDEEAFQAHMNMPYGKPFNDRLNELIVEPHSQLTFVEPFDGGEFFNDRF
ncbi:putative quinol monooxygenase [Schaalia vaccimaxillae]|uniref:putative quinol monooxygenase n=1 Tax=Schaalia vaccimaxillae TaxID=183916 RepID=UPI0003B45AB0|nr:putative quinol monooxygenase [Schaalia vaccimaxillae]